MTTIRQGASQAAEPTTLRSEPTGAFCPASGPATLTRTGE